MKSLFAAILLLPSLAFAPRPLVAVAAPVGTVDPVTWKIDASHSELTFRIRHYVTKVRGTFAKWQGTIVADPTNLSAGSVQVSIDATSIDTNNENRDADLRSNNFFAADSFPTIDFQSNRVEVQGSVVKVFGDLTIRGITKPVVLEGEHTGIMKDARGTDRIGFEVSTKINRLDHKVTWNRVLEGGGMMLGDEVEINITIEAVRQQ